MRKNILLILLALVIATTVLGCLVYRRDREHQNNYNGERHDDGSRLQININ
jgi:hypothetical protein